MKVDRTASWLGTLCVSQFLGGLVDLQGELVQTGPPFWGVGTPWEEQSHHPGLPSGSVLGLGSWGHPAPLECSLGRLCSGQGENPDSTIAMRAPKRRLQQSVKSPGDRCLSLYRGIWLLPVASMKLSGLVSIQEKSHIIMDSCLQAVVLCATKSG